MAEPCDAAASIDAAAAEPSLWDREPDLVRLQIATWEHAACVPGSWGKADRVVDLKRLLPHELTGPIYEKMAGAEVWFLRRTEPIPPFRERLARDFRERSQGFELGAGTTANAANCLTLEGELRELLFGTLGTLKLGDIVPGWDAGMAAALGANAESVGQSIGNFATLGLPRGEFLLSYGYRLDVRRTAGTLLRPALGTHGALLMGYVGPGNFQPGLSRELIDRLSR